MARGDVVYRLTLDDAGFRAQLAKTDAAVETTAGKFDAGGRGLESLRKGMLASREAIIPLASSLSGLGGTAGQVTGLVANLANVMTPGGILVAGITATVGAVTMMVREWKTAREAIEATDSLISNSFTRGLLNQQLVVEDLTARVAAYGKTQTQVMREEISLRKQATAEVLAEMAVRATADQVEIARLARKRAEAGDSKIAAFFGIRMESSESKRIGELIAARKSELEETRKIQDTAIKTTEELRLQAQLVDKIAASKAKARPSFRSPSAEEVAFDMGQGGRDAAAARGASESATAKAQRAHDANNRNKQAAAREALARELAKVDEKSGDDEVKRLERLQDRKLAALAGFVSAAGRLWGDYASIAQSAILGVFDMYLDSVEKMAAGQEVSFQELAIGFVKQIGKQLFAMGLSQTFEGAAAVIQGGIALAQGNPAGAGQIAGGAALASLGASAMAAGGAMATSGAIAGGVSARSAGGGGGGSGGGSGGRAPRRTKPGGDGEGSSSSTTIVFNGGVILGDPTERARTLARDQQRITREIAAPRG